VIGRMKRRQQGEREEDSKISNTHNRRSSQGRHIW